MIAFWTETLELAVAGLMLAGAVPLFKKTVMRAYVRTKVRSRINGLGGVSAMNAANRWAGE